MAYMRHPFYVWQDGENIHLSSPKNDGVTMSLATFDELCAMRMAQLNEGEKDEARKRAVDKWSGNFGCDDLREQLGQERMMSVAMREAKEGA